MWVFTASEERAAILETASYNQKLLALRSRRIAQQRMNYSYMCSIESAKINTLRKLKHLSNLEKQHEHENENENGNENENERENNHTMMVENKTATILCSGLPPQLVSISDDEETDLNEVFAPVPYQKGYWTMATKNKKGNKNKNKQKHKNNKNKSKISSNKDKGSPQKMSSRANTTTSTNTNATKMHVSNKNNNLVSSNSNSNSKPQQQQSSLLLRMQTMPTVTQSNPTPKSDANANTAMIAATNTTASMTTAKMAKMAAQNNNKSRYTYQGYHATNYQRPQVNPHLTRGPKNKNTT